MSPFRTAFAFTLLAVVAGLNPAKAGPEPVASTQTTLSNDVSTEPFYRDREFDASLWGTYAFTSNGCNGYNAGPDRYLEADHGFGGGITRNISSAATSESGSRASRWM